MVKSSQIQISWVLLIGITMFNCKLKSQGVKFNTVYTRWYTKQPSDWAQITNELQLRWIVGKKSKFVSWPNQSLTKLYLPHDHDQIEDKLLASWFMNTSIINFLTQSFL
jgi:hypothetical protein